MIAGAYAVLWVRQDGPGNDACRFAEAEGGFLIDGSSTDADWTVLRYRIRARGDGTTRRVRIGARSRIFIQRNAEGDWMLNGAPAPEVAGAKDIHLGFTPAALTLPIRRLALGIGDEAEVDLASLDLDQPRLTPLRLTIRRTAKDKYQTAETDSGSTSNLTVDAQGIVRAVEGRWIAQK
ncbi:putative glycolipid-binding domain-containing protein [uncultured Mameliella sp.]|uniref:putative glycolipid-binding domain-containing protein n=1 Tax=uncultured Mameliella sp. TaxID=1447087 RepID=UPI002631BE06|nr:putative glycolipid-binding domain-containing protein [uncultured Mameliella sp.]